MVLANSRGLMVEPTVERAYRALTSRLSDYHFPFVLLLIPQDQEQPVRILPRQRGKNGADLRAALVTAITQREASGMGVRPRYEADELIRRRTRTHKLVNAFNTFCREVAAYDTSHGTKHTLIVVIQDFSEPWMISISGDTIAHGNTMPLQVFDGAMAERLRP